MNPDCERPKRHWIDAIGTTWLPRITRENTSLSDKWVAR
jgi:hypothetical protein